MKHKAIRYKISLEPEVSSSYRLHANFPTKWLPVGEGTGLGLSISYQIIVDKHKGYLKCVS